MKTALDLFIQTIKESRFFQEVGLIALACVGALFIALRQKARAWTYLSQIHRSTRLPKLRLLVENWLIRNRSVTFIKPQDKDYSDELINYFGWRLMVLKPPISENEKGVLLIKFSELLHKIAISFDLPRLLKDYTLVIEPSWSGYCDRDFIFFSQFKDEIFVETPDSGDYDFLVRLNSNLIPLRVGSGDWVDPEIAASYLNLPKTYDLVMNSHWGRWKRHHVLFKTIKDLDVKVALIGFSWDGRTAEDIKALASYYGVLSKLEIFDRVPFAEVMRINAQAKFAVLLSLKEGANRAIPEAMFANTPAIVLKETVGGVAKNISAQSGIICEEKILKETLIAQLKSEYVFSARSWAIENISYTQSTAYINRILREHAERNNKPWTIDIAARKNSPELTYASTEELEALQPYNQKLVQYLMNKTSQNF